MSGSGDVATAVQSCDGAHPDRSGAGPVTLVDKAEAIEALESVDSVLRVRLAAAGVDLDEWVAVRPNEPPMASPGWKWDRSLTPPVARWLAWTEALQPAAVLRAGAAWCGKHRGWKPVEAFSRDARRPTGLQNACRACQSVRRRARYAAHRDEELLARAAWREEPGNRDRDNRRRSAHTRANPQQEAARKKARAGRARAARVVATDADTQRLFERDRRRLRARLRHRCQGCGEPVPSSQGLDHIIPYVRGGKDVIGNLWLLCTSCNSSKRDRTWMEWRVWRRRRGLADVTSARRLTNRRSHSRQR